VVVLELFAYQPFTFGRERELLLSLLKMLLGIGRHEQFLLCFKCHVVRSCWDGFLGMRLDRCHFLLITIQSTDKIVLRIAA